jgi:cellulose synthase/poly-beta-1,6-N-acetylglucosamine synthase-like glycosyltransferase
MFSAFNGVLAILVAMLIYTWLGYPILLALVARSRKQHQTDNTVPENNSSVELPRLAIILAAYNEGDVITERIDNIINLDYPHDKLDVYIGTDGCSDNTAETARSAAKDGSPRWRIQEYTVNRGKVAVLKDLVAMATNANDNNNPVDLLVFTDANTMFAKDALRKLVAPFAEPHVGGVCGRLVFVRDGSTDNPAEEGAYWKLETCLKTRESQLDSCLGANGAIYAIRPHLFWNAIPENTIVDDFVIGMKIREQGFAMRYTPSAIATETLPETKDEWVRRIRIGAGDYQALALCRRCLLPCYGWFSWAFWSHKVLRWATPHAIALLVAISFPLVLTGWWAGASIGSLFLSGITAIGMTALFAASAVGRTFRERREAGFIIKICQACNHFVSMHAALLVGFVRYYRGNLSGAWERTPRN